MKNPYRVLGIKKNATIKQIKDAYRKMSKKYHPDMKGGDQEKFKEVNKAYEILKDADIREKYDKYGVVPGTDEFFVFQQAINLLGGLFLQCIDQLENADDILSVDIVKSLNINIKTKLSDVRKNQAILDKEYNKYVKLKEHLEQRLKKGKKVKSPDILMKVIYDKIATLESDMEVKEKDLAILEKMLEIVSDYEFDFPKQIATFSVSFGGGTGSATTSF